MAAVSRAEAAPNGEPKTDTEEWVCASCLDLEITESIETPCGHKICQPCAAKLVKRCERFRGDRVIPVGHTDSFACPLCTADIPFTVSQGVDFFGLVEKPVVVETTDEDTTLCDMCAENNAKRMCLQCGPLCDDCHGATHKKGKFKDHGISVIRKDKKEAVKCVAHNKNFEVYCYDCETRICALCAQFGIHQVHDCRPLTEAYDVENSNIDEMVNDSAVFCSSLQAGIGKIDDVMTAVEREATRHQESVVKHFDFLQAQLEKRRQKILTDLEKVRSKKIEILSKQKDNVEFAQTLVAEGRDASSHLQKVSQFHELMKRRHLMQRRIANVPRLALPIIPQETDFFACFMERRALNDAAAIQQLGMMEVAPQYNGDVFQYRHDFDRNGILYWIGQNYGQEFQYINPAERQLIEVSVSSVEHGLAKYAVGHPETQNHNETYISENAVNSWMMIHFGGEYQVYPTAYTVRNCPVTPGHTLSNWILEGSNDGCDWTILDNRKNDTTLIPSRASAATFECKPADESFSRVRIRLTGPNRHVTAHSNFYYLMLSGFELYGVVRRIGKTS